MASLIDEGLFKTILKCSAQQLSKAGFSVMSVVPSDLSSGVAPNLAGPHTAVKDERFFT